MDNLNNPMSFKQIKNFPTEEIPDPDGFNDEF